MKRKISLGAKTTCLVLLAYILYSAVSIVIGYSDYTINVDEHYKRLAVNIARTAAGFMDGDKIPLYAETMTKDEDYFRMLDILFEIKNDNDILFLYVEIISGDNVVYIMDADTSETAYELGEARPLAAESYKYLDNLEHGIPPFITHSNFGWLSSAYAPVFDSRGRVSALVGVDISMDEVAAEQHSYLVKLLLAMIAAVTLTIYVFLKLLRRFIIIPVNRLAAAAESFVTNGPREESAGLATSSISRLDIHTGDEIESLCAAMKTMAGDITEYVKNITEITSERERISAELNIAARIQLSMLPRVFPPFPDRLEFGLYAVMIPAKEVGGDFYDFFMIDGDHLGMVIADVSGKGVPAALFMVISKTLIRGEMTGGEDLGEVITAVNRQLCGSNDENMFVTAWAAVLEISTGTLAYVNAGHNPPLVKRAEAGFEYIKEQHPAMALAVMPETNYRRNRIKLSPGDSLYLYTDGVTEAMDTSMSLYGEDRLKRVLNASPSVDPEKLLVFLINDIKNFVGSTSQSDDITMLGIHINEG
jgi:sigma-B regulation protein RsbU (phosphoserine phosphatase)